jgi:hypothetical protein
VLRSRPLVTLLLAVVVGTAAGIALARLSDDNPAPGGGAPVITLGRQESVDSPAGVLTMAFPDDWFGGRATVNCDTAPEVHASTDDVVLQSLRTGDGQTGACIPELDPRALSSGGGYVSAAFLRLADVGCGSSIPTVPPDGIAHMEADAPSDASLREFGAAGAYDRVEWRHATWCVPGGYAVRVEVFLGRSASSAVRDEVDVVVRALQFAPAQ